MLQYPTTNIKFPEPIIGWNNSYKLIEKYYYDDVFLHMYIASKGKSAECSKNGKSFTSSCNRSSKLMDVLTIKLKEYINLDIEKGDM